MISAIPLLPLLVAFSSVTGLSSMFAGGRRSRRTHQQERMENVVRRYFQGVNDKDPALIRSCFGDTATIRDVCGISNGQRTVPAQALVDRCMDFLAAHPDTVVDFHHGPECGRNSDWVFAHWYETGTWSGTSCGIEPTNRPMAVEGQTRFRVDPKDLVIREFVVTRTFTDWEKAYLSTQERKQEPTQTQR